nr:HEPN domain-containing protein [Caulobacter sp. CCH5-E12]
MLRSDLDHLPVAKRRELERVVQLLFEEFQASLEGRSASYRCTGKILKVILFGSFARGDWVEDRGSGYLSDFDLLVVVNHDKLTDIDEYWRSAEDRFSRELRITKTLRRPVNFIVHSVADVNRQLKHGRPFFLDIVRDGIALYEAPGHALTKPAPLSAEAAREEAQGYFDEWFCTADQFLETARDHVARGPKWSNKAAFELHQAAERFYHCALLVLTLYSPKLHKLNMLRDLAEGVDARLIAAWPRDTRFSRRVFDRIRRAYVEARYSPHYRITADEMAEAVARAEALRNLVEIICQERLAAPNNGTPP